MVIFSTPLGVLIRQEEDKALGGCRGESGSYRNAPSSLSANSHGPQSAENTLKGMDVNGAVLNYSSLPGAAGSCPLPGLCDLKARS